MTEIHWAVPGPPLLGAEAVEGAVAAALELGGRPGLELVINFVGEEALTTLHAEHLDDPSATDVITFDLGEDGVGPAGELYVSVERARSVAQRRGVAPERELTLYVVHGVLHLCGFDDRRPEDAERMRAAEAETLVALGHPPDAQAHDLGVD